MSIYLGETSEQYNQIILKNRNEDKEITKFSIKTKNSNEKMTAYQVNFEGKDGFVYFKEDIYKFIEKADVDILNNLGKETFVTIDDLELLTINDVNELELKSRNKDKEVEMSLIKINGNIKLKLRKSVAGTKVVKDGQHGYIIMISKMGKFFAEDDKLTCYFVNEKYVSEEEKMSPKKCLTNLEKKQLNKISFDKREENEYDSIKRFCEKEEIKIVDFPEKFEDFKKIEFMKRMQFKSIQSKIELFEDHFGKKPFLSKDGVTISDFMDSIKKQKMDIMAEEKFKRFKDKHGFYLENYLNDDEFTLTVKDKNDIEISRLIAKPIINEEIIEDYNTPDFSIESLEFTYFNIDLFNELESNSVKIIENNKEFNDIENSNCSKLYEELLCKGFVLSKQMRNYDFTFELNDLGIEENSEGTLELIDLDLSDKSSLVNWLNKQKNIDVTPNNITIKPRKRKF